ncbi:AP-2 complex subunit alpha, putative [Plasmodium chabaudi chabaudi]|uniref:AP-2 complex subunit alpha, putative n=1 Tax=Plasmodium chabaudi chabaudi TaxID=31271 RepID=A0A4V0K868_PLACU|nr:AP-2 complex subunit alpha, putative [Plasmodium chabaudi chabaudi]VTZ69157.1 AP-2 complex subunit alpha, putative [Plasmodium chabaudi chabaudi]|eukprot:XP_016653967.1 AP-2 complex subunit alpha, putative [Plasmodium chabaudi chabaudi]
MLKYNIKGLYCFIEEVRNCKSKEEEEQKILGEIIKIKKQFNEKNLTNYKRKKYIWKLIYCHILGYSISLPYLNIIKLISSSDFSDKYCGYTALSLLVHDNNEILNMMVSTIKLDIKNYDEKINFLALHFTSHKINELLVENLYEDILHIVTSNYIYKPNIRKKAFLCLANIYKKRHDLLFKNKNDLEIFKFLDQNISEINMFNACSYLNLIYIIILIFQKYETLFLFTKKKEDDEKKKKNSNRDDDPIINSIGNKRENYKDETSSAGSLKNGNKKNKLNGNSDEDKESNNNSDSNSIDSDYVNRNNSPNIPSHKRFSINIKDELKKKKGTLDLIIEQNLTYTDLKRAEKFGEIESECSINVKEINFFEINKYINKYINYIINIIYLILDENLKIDEGFYYSQFRYPFLLIKCLQMIQLYEMHSLSQSILNNINDILYKILSKSYKKFKSHSSFWNISSIDLVENYQNNMNMSPNQNPLSKNVLDKNNIYLNNRKKEKNGSMKINKSIVYIEYAIIYECSSIYNFLDDKVEERNRDLLLTLIISSLNTKKSNIKYVILNCLSQFKITPQIYNKLEKHISYLVKLLQSDDITIKLQTFNILFNMCNTSNWKYLINIFLQHLPYVDPYIQNEIIIKICILAEQFSTNMAWYIDVIFKIIEIAHKYIFKDVCYRCVQVLTGFAQNKKAGNNLLSMKDDNSDTSSNTSNDNSNNKKNTNRNNDIINNTEEEKKAQMYAAMKCYRYLSKNICKIELLIDLCSYIIGSFGHLIKNKIPMKNQFKILEKYYKFTTTSTKSVILLALMKMVFYEHKLVGNVKKILSDCIDHPNLELQTRACEFMNLCNTNNFNLINSVLKNMPLYNTRKMHKNFLIKRLIENNKHANIDLLEKDTQLINEKFNDKNKPNKYANFDEENDEVSKYSSDKVSSDSSDESYNKRKAQDDSSSSSSSSSSSDDGDSKKSSNDSSSKSKTSDKGSEDNGNLFKMLGLQKANNINELWLNGCLLDKSLFYKNAVISILLKQRYQENKAIFQFYIKNISKGPIKIMSINIEESEQIKIKEQKNINNEIINADEVCEYKLNITVSDIFYVMPIIFFNVTAPTSPNLMFSSKLPILITRFIKENKINEASFKMYWKGFTQIHSEDTVMGLPKHSKKILVNYLTSAFNFYVLKIGTHICASGSIHFPTTNTDNKILILVKIRYEARGCQISVISSIKPLNNYLNKIFEVYLIKSK